MSDFKVTRYKLRASGMSVRGPEESFWIVFLSDLHNKSYGKGNERLLQEIRNQDPEAVLIGGDLLTSADPPQMEAALELMKELTRWYPIYAVNGNHEQRLKEQTEKYHGSKRWNGSIKDLGYCHNEEYFGENGSAQMDVCKQRNTEVHHIFTKYG